MFRQSHNPFELSPSHSPYLGAQTTAANDRPLRQHQASSARLYRRHYKEQELPLLRTDPEGDGYSYLVKTPVGWLYLRPVFRELPSIGTGRSLDTLWRASTTYTHSATRFHPEEADEVEFCDARNLLEAVHCGMAHLTLWAMRHAVSAEEECRQFLSEKAA